MKKIKNANKKTVCTADADKKTVEIVRKGYKTVIRFMPDGSIKVINTSTA